VHHPCPETSVSCAKCNSDDVITGVRILDRAHGGHELDLEAVVYRDPNAMLFKEAEKFALTGRICGKCGYTELYVSNPEALAEAARAAGNKG
jgi:hypothetical protein